MVGSLLCFGIFFVDIGGRYLDTTTGFDFSWVAVHYPFWSLGIIEWLWGTRVTSNGRSVKGGITKSKLVLVIIIMLWNKQN